MADVQIKLSAIWVVLMLSYVVGDVLRIFSGSFTAGKIAGKTATERQWLWIAVMMVLPIAMVFLALILPYAVNRWANILIAVGLFVVNASGLSIYPSTHDRFLIVVGLLFNALTVYYAWTWVLS
jgi:hypothetical protein